MKKTALLPVLIYGALYLAGCSGSSVISSSVGKDLEPSQRFTLKNPKGEAVSLDQVLSSHKSVLLNFWATWCSYCVEEMPDLVKLQERLSPQGFTVLAVDVGESAEQVAAFADRAGLNFPIVLDTDNTVAQNYGLVGIPVSYLIDSSGKIIGEYHGFTSKLVKDAEASLKEGSGA